MLEKNNIDCKNVYEVYSAVKSNKKTKIKINVSEAEKLLELLQLKIKNQNE